MSHPGFSYEGKVALVVGGASGIGEEIAAGLENGGAKVMVADIQPAELKLDVCSEQDWIAAVTKVEEKFGGLDLLANTAGGGVNVPVDEMEEAEFDRIVRLNLSGVFLGMKTCFPAMRRRGGGSIVNFGSNLALSALPGLIAYGAAKAGVIHAGRIAAIEGAPDKIRVNTVLPGVTRTPMTEEALKSPEFRRLTVDPVPLGRPGDVEEVAAAALFLLSDAATYITGTEIVADGGLVARY